jgi:hypothetical protein
MLTSGERDHNHLLHPRCKQDARTFVGRGAGREDVINQDYGFVLQLRIETPSHLKGIMQIDDALVSSIACL